MISRIVTFLVLTLSALLPAAAQSTLVLAPAGAAKGRHVVLLSGDEEYRSEEGLPMLAKILSQRHGFKCTVLFALDPDGRINPDNVKSLAGAEALDSADLIIMALRMRAWPDDQMKHFVDAYRRGTPIVALRTSTHAFKIAEGGYQAFTDFGKNVLGEQWVSHWGKHKFEATRGVIEPSAVRDPLLNGVADVFGTTDVYEAYPPADAKILLRGRVLKGMNPGDPPAEHAKKRATDKQEQPVNNPMMAVAWTRLYRNDAGRENRILCTTMGAATDLQSEDLRRLVVNGVYWGLGLKVPAKADVRYVDAYAPTMYGFRSFRRGLTPADHALGKVLRAGDPAPPAPPRRAAPAKPSAALPFSLNPGEHVAIIGNALGDRMQHHGWLETMIHAKNPQHRLVVRNLAVSGDELATRLRSKDFGTPEEWLARVQAGAIFAFFGFNESFQGPAGLPKFKEDLDRFLRETRAKNFTGLGAPRIVLFSPIANEKHPDPNFAVPPENNTNLALYTAAMAEVAGDRSGVVFVDLFKISQELFAEAARQGQPLTFNGIHLTDAGEARLAAKIFPALFGENPPTGAHEKLRAAINDKNAMWHARYRTVDGYNVYGGRSQLAFPKGKDATKITNFQVMQEEMLQRDVLTANRDRRVWAVAQGGDLQLDDQNLPPVTPVPTNKPGPNPDGTYAFVSGEEAIAKMTVSPGLKVNLFASEEQFPELAKPVQMAWDTRGRLWVAAWPSYPERTPDSKTGDSLLVFEDTDRDGRADKCTHFIDDLNSPTGFQFYKDGVLLMQAPDLWFIRDTDGDGKADWKERVLMGLDSADTHHTTNSMALEPGGAVYLSDGVFHRTQVETARGPVRNDDGAIYRYEPRTGRLEVYVSYDFANPHGRTFDRWGNDLITDATSNKTYFGAAFSGHIDYPAKHPLLKPFWPQASRPSPGSSIITSRHFPDEFQGNFLNCNVIGFLGIYRVKVEDDGSGLKGERLTDFVSSTDPNFRPAGLGVGPDGAVYFIDWHNPIIGHMQHHLRDPSRDHVHGRIYRVTYEGLPLAWQPKIHDQPTEALIELLEAPENHVRELAKVELGKHDSAAVIAAVKRWMARLDARDPEYQHRLTEALWVHQWHNIVDRDLLGRMLRSPSPDARAAATRVLCYWRDRVPDVLSLLKVQAADENPRVRLHAVRAASFFRSEAAVDVALTAIKFPLDYYLEYTLGETIKQLTPHWRNALGSGSPLFAADPARIPFVLRTVNAPDLSKLPRTNEVLDQIVKRPGVLEAVRIEALTALARARNTSAIEILLAHLESAAEIDAPSLGKLLVTQPPDALKPVRARLSSLAAGARTEVRPHAWAALVIADGSFDTAWPEAEKSASHLANLLSGIPMIPDPALRATAHRRVTPLLERAQSPGSVESAEALQRAAILAAVSTRQEGPAVFQTLTKTIQRGESVPTAAQGLRALPRTAWSDTETVPTVTALIGWAKQVSSRDRTGRDYLGTVQAAEELVARLPAGDAAPFLKQLRTVRVSTTLVRTVPEEMRYDTTRIVVEPGKTVIILVENPDAMPHNLVVVKPGARERVATAALLLSPDQLDALGRAYTPDSTDVVAGTKLIDPGQNETLRFIAPPIEGVYEYVCTFPGHWTLMWGQLIVTNDPAAYLEQQVPAKSEPPKTAATTSHVHKP